jgi:hypothetical protein
LDAGDVGRDGFVRTADLRGSVRLHVPRIELAGTADEHQHDAVHVAGGIDLPGGLQREEIPERKSEQSQRAGMQKIPAAHAVAELDALFCVESEHQRPPVSRDPTINQR